MARKKKAAVKKAAPRKAKAKRKPGRPKGSRNTVSSQLDVLSDRLSSHLDEFESVDVGLQATVERVDRLDDALNRAGSVGHLEGRLAAQAQVVEDMRTRLNDALYRIEQLEERLRKGPGLLPMLVANATDFANLKPQALAQMLLEKLAEPTTQE